jgi:predicted GNAT family acetyltransferase
MQIQHKLVGNKGMFYVENEGDIQAEMVYTMAGADKMIIEHTEVGDELRGQSVGAQLVAAAVDHARKHHIKILPLCPFASSVFKKKLEYKDVLFE